ncbi:Protein lin-52 homolog [Geodia barretti]|uniref:Protein lin-52 homolog n=1 Tax=Geodia barretti TaxID=519541 RepID=A0AA35TI34_GEOBA|nr:Protein lin-52 homolog [Geodia barretti]
MEGGQVEGGETELLLSSERLSSDSPVMWPDQQHFFGDFNPLHLSPAPPDWLLDVTRDDMASINELACLTPAQLMEKIRGLQNLAYQLGVEEARQMSRGRHLNVLHGPVRHVSGPPDWTSQHQ